MVNPSGLGLPLISRIAIVAPQNSLIMQFSLESTGWVSLDRV